MCRCASRGFSLLEMVIALTLLSAAALVGLKTWSTSMQVSRDAPESAASLTRFDVAVDRLRRDVWSAHELRVDAGHTVRLDDGVIWRIIGKDALERTGDGRFPQRWNKLGMDLSLAADGPVLVLRAGDAQVRLVSEVQILEARP